MLPKLVRIFPVLLLFQQSSLSNVRPTLQEYCKLNKDNIPCRYKCEHNSSNCGPKTYKYQHLTFEEKSTCLAQHNRIRDQVAAGTFVKQGLESAANMMVMSWDKECEWFIACFIQQCKTVLEGMFQPMGEKLKMDKNIYWRVDRGSKLEKDFVQNGIKYWIAEKEQLGKEWMKKVVDSFQKARKPHMTDFTQIIWAKTMYVGCVKYVFVDPKAKVGGKNNTKLFMCSYFPAGNIVGERIYIRGDSVSQCPQGVTANDEYPNLCGVVRDFKLDAYVGPIDFDPDGTAQFNRAYKRFNTWERRIWESEDKKRRSSFGEKPTLSWNAVLLLVLLKLFH